MISKPAGCIVETVAAKKPDRVGCRWIKIQRRAEGVVIVRLLHRAASAAVGFDANATFSVGECAILNSDIRHAAGSTAAHRYTVSVAIRAIPDMHIRRTAAAGEVVVADADVAILDEHVGAGHVTCVGVVAW